MKKVYIAIIIVITAGIFLTDTRLLSRSLFSLFSNREYSAEGLNRVLTYNPDDELLYLPDLDNKNVFQAIDDLSICRRADVRKYIYIYSTYGREYTVNAIKKSELYMDTIEEEFAKNPEIPTELMLLPLLESGFNPNAVSRSNAVGLWQFMAPTARALGLKNDKWVDERRDIQKSTAAAIRHLRGLYQTFNKWDLAVAGYNGGCGHVGRAMKRANSTDYWKLADNGYLSKQTSEYIARYAALMIIYKNQDLLDIDIPSNEIIKTGLVKLNNPVNLTEIAALSGTSLNKIYQFNPQLKANMTPPYYNQYSLRLPEDGCKKLENDRNRLTKLSCKTIKSHTIRKGESLSQIAKKYHADMDRIIIINNLQKPYRLQPGNVIYIPI